MKYVNKEFKWKILRTNTKYYYQNQMKLIKKMNYLNNNYKTVYNTKIFMKIVILGLKN